MGVYIPYPRSLYCVRWQEAVDRQWLDSAAISNSTDLEQRLFQEFKITYQTGKGNNHLVPILFPLDTCPGMMKLTDQTIRSYVGIHQNNVYAFPNSKHSLDHVNGWHSVHRVSTDAEIQGVMIHLSLVSDPFQ